MTKKLLIFFTLAMCILQAAACRRPAAPSFGPADLQSVGWDELERRARGATVNFAMWAGDEERNTYYQTKVTSRLKEKFGVTLNIIPLGDTADAITKLLNEKGAGKTSGGSVDMLWINGQASANLVGRVCGAAAERPTVRPAGRRTRLWH
jgi:putative spermidine/putrescine transport system substrate-binding protein